MKKVSLYILIFLAGFANRFLDADDLSDEKGYREVSTTVSETLESYEHALQAWKTPEDINVWIASNFS